MLIGAAPVAGRFLLGRVCRRPRDGTTLGPGCNVGPRTPEEPHRWPSDAVPGRAGDRIVGSAMSLWQHRGANVVVWACRADDNDGPPLSWRVDLGDLSVGNWPSCQARCTARKSGA